MTDHEPHRYALDPVTFEVLKNAFITTVNQMTEQILRTCYSFVIYNHDFSNALCDRDGNTIAQGDQDLAAHVGTLHLTCKDVIRFFKGEMKQGDVYAINDPYAGGTHFPDVRLIRPIFADGELIAFSQSNGHWADVGGSVPGSMDVLAKEMFREGLRITPVRLWDGGRFCRDVAHLIANNTRDPESIIGDMHAQAEATAVAEREIGRLVAKYGKDTIVTGMADVQDYVERTVRHRLSELPNGEWSTVDFIDCDYGSGREGMIPIQMKVTIKDDAVTYDFTGSHPCVKSIYNCCSGATLSGVVSSMKTFFPDLPLNSGFYRPIDLVLPEDSVVSARWPVAVTGYIMPFEKLWNMSNEIWSQVAPDRATACMFNIEYLEIGGRDARRPEKDVFMFYDWMVGGWGGRHKKDGVNLTTSCFGTGLQSQPVEGQERMAPILTRRYEALTDSAGPGQWRGGVGVVKSAEVLEVEGAVASYVCDRAASVVWGIDGGLPSLPHGLTLHRGAGEPQWLGSVFSDIEIQMGDVFSRPTAGGGGLGDPLERSPELVCQDVADDYVSIERARRDYGVVLEVIDKDLAEYAVDEAATRTERQSIRERRRGWLAEEPEAVALKYRNGEIDAMDAVRRYAVILDWGTGELLPQSTVQFRTMFMKRSAAHWKDAE